MKFERTQYTYLLSRSRANAEDTRFSFESSRPGGTVEGGSKEKSRRRAVVEEKG